MANGKLGLTLPCMALEIVSSSAVLGLEAEPQVIEQSFALGPPPPTRSLPSKARGLGQVVQSLDSPLPFKFDQILGLA